MSYPQNTDDTIQSSQLKSLIERIEKLEGERADIADDISEVYKESKANGFDTRVMKKVIAIRRRDPNERAEEEAIVDLYLQAVGENRDEPEQRAPKQRVGASKAQAAVDASAVKLVKMGVSMEVPENAGPVIQGVAAAMERACGKVERKGKSIVGSFTPPADDTPPDGPF